MGFERITAVHGIILIQINLFLQKSKMDNKFLTFTNSKGSIAKPQKDEIRELFSSIKKEN